MAPKRPTEEQQLEPVPHSLGPSSTQLHHEINGGFSSFDVLSHVLYSV